MTKAVPKPNAGVMRKLKRRMPTSEERAIASDVANP